jgi:hypothetical protein
LDVSASQVDQCFFITEPVRPSCVVVKREKRGIIRMEGAAIEQDFNKYGDQTIEEEFDKYFDMPSDAARRRKTILPATGCPYTRRNPHVTGLNYSTVTKKGKKVVMSRRRYLIRNRHCTMCHFLRNNHINDLSFYVTIDHINDLWFF